MEEDYEDDFEAPEEDSSVLQRRDSNRSIDLERMEEQVKYEKGLDRRDFEVPEDSSDISSLSDGSNEDGMAGAIEDPNLIPEPRRDLKSVLKRKIQASRKKQKSPIAPEDEKTTPGGKKSLNSNIPKLDGDQQRRIVDKTVESKIKQISPNSYEKENLSKLEESLTGVNNIMKNPTVGPAKQSDQKAPTSNNRTDMLKRLKQNVSALNKSGSQTQQGERVGTPKSQKKVSSTPFTDLVKSFYEGYSQSHYDDLKPMLEEKLGEEFKVLPSNGPKRITKITKNGKSLEFRPENITGTGAMAEYKFQIEQTINGTIKRDYVDPDKIINVIKKRLS